jgi:hypothetical protein
VTFGQLIGISDDFDWDTLEYDKICNSDFVKALIGPFSGELSTVGFLAAPYGSVLRLAEGIDAIRNLAVSTVPTNATDHERAGAIACGFAQFGGILWLAFVVTIVTVTLGVSLPCALCCLRVCRRIRRGGQKAAERQQAIDELLQNAIDTGKIEATGTWKIMRAPAQTRGAREEREGLLGEEV